MYRKTIVGYHDSDGSQDALALASQLAQSTGAQRRRRGSVFRQLACAHGLREAVGELDGDLVVVGASYDEVSAASSPATSPCSYSTARRARSRWRLPALATSGPR